MPVDSTRVISITMHIEAMAVSSKRGRPKWKGVVRAIQLASSRPSNCMRPSASDSPTPKTMPSSTAMLATRPLPKRVIAMIAASTAAAMERFTGSP